MADLVNIENKLKKMIASQLNIKEEKLDSNAKIIDDLGADSLDIVEMFMTLEEEFEITIPDDKVIGLKTVGDVVNFVKNELDNK